MGEQMEVTADGSVKWAEPSRWYVERDVVPLGVHLLRYGRPGTPGRLQATFNPLVSVIVTDVLVSALNERGVTPNGWL
jgi:hypothetical protein